MIQYNMIWSKYIYIYIFIWYDIVSSRVWYYMTQDTYNMFPSQDPPFASHSAAGDYSLGSKLARAWTESPRRELRRSRCGNGAVEDGRSLEASVGGILNWFLFWLVVTGTWIFFPYIGNNDPNRFSYFAEGYVYHQPVLYLMLQYIPWWFR